MADLTTARIDRNREALVALNKLSGTVQRQLLPSLKKYTLLAIVECPKNIILDRVELTESQLKWMRERERDLRKLVARRTPHAKRVEILQQGGFLGRLLAPVLIRSVGGLTQKLIDKI